MAAARARGFRPLDPPFCPPSLAEGSPGFWAPLVGRLLRWATRPLFWFCGGTPHSPPPWGLRPPGPPFCPPSLAEGSPAFWVPLMAGLKELTARPFLRFGGHPQWPPSGGSAPLDPPLLLQTGVEPLLTKGALTILEHAFKHLALKTKLFLTKL